MKISNMTKSRISSSKLMIDQPTIFLVFPDTNIKIWDLLYQTNFVLSNCEAIISPGNMVKFMRKSFNSKAHSLDFKKKMIQLEEKSKSLKILSNIHVKEASTKSAKYYFYDMSVYSNAIKSFDGKIFPKKLIEELLLSSGKIYKQIKDNYPNYNVDMLFLMKDDKGFLWQMFDNLKMWFPLDKLNDINFFDNFCFVSTGNKYILPIISREDGKSEYITKHLKKLPGYFVEDEITTQEQIVKSEKEPGQNSTNSNAKTKHEPEIETEIETKSDIKGIVKGLTKEIGVNTNIDEDGEIKVEIDTKQLKKILSNYEIKDPAILSNVKLAIDRYLTSNVDSKKKMTREQAEILILKAVNKTVHGSDEIRDSYKNNPKLLFDKLKNQTNYRVPLQFPKYENELIQPKDVVDLDYTCGQHRQKFEFNDTVHQTVEKLFRTLEDLPNYPVKIKKIKHEIIDTDSDRLIQYTITLQNVGGGHSKPYDIKLNIPGLVSERYFKLKNAHYVMENQQFMKPITKTDPNEVRLLSNFAIIRVSLTNFKFNSANIREYIDYIKLKYPTFIKELTDDHVILFNGDKFGLTGNLVFTNKNESVKIEIDPETNNLINLADRSSLGITKYEYQLDRLYNKLKEIYKDESLSKSKLKIPYLEIYLGGLKLPLILYLWSQKGLLTTLNDESIDYKITDGKPLEDASIHIRTNKNQFLNIYPDNFRQTTLINGLIKLQGIFSEKNIDDLNNPESSYNVISEYTSSSGSIRMISYMTENEIDPITKDLLEFDGNSTNLVKLVSKDMVDILFKKKPDNLADLSIYRSILSEMIFRFLYKQIRMAHNHYRSKVFGFEDQEAKIEIVEDFVTQSLVTQSGVLQNAEPFNPVDEIALASRVVKSGKGGKMHATLCSNA